MSGPSAGRPAAVPAVQIDEDRVRVTEWRFAPNAATGWHRHAHPYVVVPIVSGQLEIDDGRETRTAELVAGRSYARPAGVAHDVRNASGHEISFVEIELK